MRVVAVVLVVLLVVLQVELWRQYGQINQLEDQFKEQIERNKVLDDRNAALAAEVEDLKSGLEAVEERARAELGLVREGERFYLVVDPEDLPDGQSEAVRALETLPVDPRGVEEGAGIMEGESEEGDGEAGSGIEPPRDGDG